MFDLPLEQLMLNLTSVRVVVVEDNLMLGQILDDFLADSRATLHHFTTGDDALVAVLGGLRPDLLITDHLMPGQLKGAELAQMLLSRWPGMPTIITTGYEYSVSAELPAHVVFLQKPWLFADLEKAIRQALH